MSKQNLSYYDNQYYSYDNFSFNFHSFCTTRFIFIFQYWFRLRQIISLKQYDLNKNSLALGEFKVDKIISAG